ncbi:DUF1707 SHOCT-like domain-containing protein [Actinomycetospora soli]|uniref:DUF1707 SHOCT-like domain-containing protein n=1 Tax=Actinomycetospora soli TaxID=2893887 RepID=UPI001E2D6078|nr:DUF1707 domain-containing protein [Actinomycetospora soli]MCD2189101.1 DUF1707 domain-containing protein [Actinomycetospora soli]
MSDPTPAVRASDAEREQVADLVRRAVGDGRLTMVEGDERQRAAYAATFRHELAPITADLEPEPTAQPSRPAVGKEIATRPDATGSVAVMSGADRSGTWTPGLTHRAVSVMGGTSLDLRHANLDSRGLTLQVVSVMGGANVDLRGVGVDVTVQAFALMGGCEVVVDPDAVVEVTGVGFMGGFADQAGAPSGTPGPRVKVSGFAMMGGVSVTRRPLAVESGQ